MKEIFYSNGVDIFGPVSLHEFCSNRYYKSTLIWYEGLTGWVNIEDCDDFKHLIGTMPTPALDSVTPQPLPDIAPPLSKRTVPARSSNRKYMVIALILFLTLLGLSAYYFNSRVDNSSEAAMASDTMQSSTPVIDSVATREAELVRKAQLETEMKTHRMNWEKFIIAVPNDYKQRDIGGIDDLKVIVKNTSPYTIDKVSVKVSYIKANGDVYQTEMLQFDNVPANDNKELFAPKSDRGVKVTCTIIAVTSQEMNFCMDKADKDFSKKTGEDPFKCMEKI